MSVHNVFEASLLALVVVCCWVGVIGMWRMREPVQALHYLSLPAAFGSVLLAIAVFVATGFTQALSKALFIAFVLFWSNSVVGHALGRAFRARQLGHWEPRDGDPMNFVTSNNEDAS